jgi:hypothetical protein
VVATVEYSAHGRLRCPVDHKWRVAGLVRVYEAEALPQAELDEAMRHRF